MKLLKIILGLAFGAGIFFIITRIARLIDPNRHAIEAAKRQAEIERIEQITRWQGQALTASIVLLYALIGVVALLGILFAVRLWRRNRQAMSNNYQRDGSFPLRRLKLPGGREILINPNNMVSSALGIDPSLGAFEFEASAGWDRQLAKAQAAQGTHTFIAMAGAPRATAPMVKGALGAKGYQPARPRIIGMDPAAENGVTSGPPPTLDRLLDSARPAALPFGFDSGGQLAIWHASSTPHLRIHGATRKGKTSAALALVAAASSQGWHSIVVDPRRFKDWGMADSVAELVDARTPESFVAALESVHDEYLRREQILSENNAPDISALNGNAPARICLLIEELGAQRLRAQQAGTIDEVDHLMGILSAEAAADGIHIVALDQRPDQYDKRVKANLAPVVFGLPSGAGQAAGYAQAHSLDRFNFYYDGSVWRSVDAAQDFARVLADKPMPPHAPIVNSTATSAATSAATTSDTGHPVNGRWDNFVANWFATEPDDITAVQANLAKAMAAADPRKRPYTAFKSLANDYFHRRGAERPTAPQHSSLAPEIIEAGTPEAQDIAEWLKANRSNVRLAE